MFRLCVYVSVLVALATAGQNAQGTSDEEEMMNKLVKNLPAEVLHKILAEPQIPERYLPSEESPYESHTIGGRVLQFSWKNCGSDSDPLSLKSLTIGPDPIHIPGDLTVSFNAKSTMNVTDPFKVKVVIQKKIIIWITVPCFNGQGSCNYDDFCSVLPTTCPPSFQKNHIPCHCPIQAGEYSLSSGIVTIPPLGLPDWLKKGDYKAQLTGTDTNNKRMFCVALTLSMN